MNIKSKIKINTGFLINVFWNPNSGILWDITKHDGIDNSNGFWYCDVHIYTCVKTDTCLDTRGMLVFLSILMLVELALALERASLSTGFPISGMLSLSSSFNTFKKLKSPPESRINWFVIQQMHFYFFYSKNETFINCFVLT